jgi:hypothetical protein
MRSLLLLFLLPSLGLSASSAPAGAQCATGTITASLSSDPGFIGQYKYCVDASWDLVQHELSHLDVFLQLPDCPCICHPSFIGFTQPAGQSTETGDVCVQPYTGSYLCKGDPSLPAGFNGPAVKFQPDASLCDPGINGSGTFCFYSPMPPAPPSDHANAIAIKHGQDVCYASLTGSLPSCDCALPTQALTWGSVKSMYR